MMNGQHVRQPKHTRARPAPQVREFYLPAMPPLNAFRTFARWLHLRHR